MDGWMDESLGIKFQKFNIRFSCFCFSVMQFFVSPCDSLYLNIMLSIRRNEWILIKSELSLILEIVRLFMINES